MHLLSPSPILSFSFCMCVCIQIYIIHSFLLQCRKLVALLYYSIRCMDACMHVCLCMLCIRLLFVVKIQPIDWWRQKTTLNLVPLYITFSSLILNYGFEFFMFYLYIVFNGGGRTKRADRVGDGIYTHTHTNWTHKQRHWNREILAFGWLVGWLVT